MFTCQQRNQVSRIDGRRNRPLIHRLDVVANVIHHLLAVLSKLLVVFRHFTGNLSVNLKFCDLPRRAARKRNIKLFPKSLTPTIFHFLEFIDCFLFISTENRACFGYGGFGFGGFGGNTTVIFNATRLRQRLNRLRRRQRSRFG